MKLIESVILITATVLATLAALFTLIGLTTPRWLRYGIGLWNCNNICSSWAATLTILAFICLIVGVASLILFVIRLLPNVLRSLPVILLVVATLFLLTAKASYLRKLRVVGYSYDLMVAAHGFAFIASTLLAFWLGQTLNEKPSVTTPRAGPHTTTIVLPPPRRA